MIPIFLSSFAVFGYLALLSPTLSFILGGTALHLILAPTWVAFSTAFFVWTLAGDRLRGLLSRRTGQIVLSGLIAVSICVALALLSEVQNQINAKMLDILNFRSVSLIEQLIFPAETDFLLRVAALSSIPFFFYGLYLSTCFQLSERDNTSYVLTAEFLGMLLGMSGSALALDTTGDWSKSFAICVAFAIFGACWIYGAGLQRRKKLALSAALLFSFACGFAAHDMFRRFEPQRSAALTLRDFGFTTQIKQIDSQWTTYGKVQHFWQKVPRREINLIALGGGSGIARIVGGEKFTSSVVEVARLFSSKSTLVLFAGAGADIVGLFDSSPSDLKLTGVELNPRIVDLGLNPAISRIPELIRTGRVRLLNEEARVFLETGREKFDQILFSFAGATMAHYSGAIMHTTQYTLTREALARAWSRLEPGGHLIFKPGSKMNLLLSLKSLEAEGVIGNLADSTMILTTAGDDRWRRGWDEQTLVLKKGGFSSSDVATALEKTKGTQTQVVLAPGIETAFPFRFHRRILDSKDAGPVLTEIQSRTGLNFSDFTDDKPFVHLVRPPTDYSSVAAFSGSTDLKKGSKLLLNPKVLSLILLVLLGIGVAFFVALFLSASGFGLRTLSLAISAGLGAIFLGLTSAAIQLVVAYKCVLFIGNPTYALAISCVGVAGGGLIGAWACRVKRSAAFILVGATVSAIVFLATMRLAFDSAAIEALFSVPLTMRLVLILLVSLVCSSGFSFAFPFLLSSLNRTQKRVLHLAIFVDGLASAFCAVLGPTTIEDFGLLKFSYGATAAAMLGAMFTCLYVALERSGRTSS